jgi:Sec-independent protein secretion pathway component TatC
MGYFIVACVGVALPGVDPVTTCIEIVPLWLLFEASIQLSRVVERRRGDATLTAPWHAQP